VKSVAFVGPIGSGKSTLAWELVARGYKHHSWADAIKETARFAYPNLQKQDTVLIKRGERDVQASGRVVFQSVGLHMREFSSDFWVLAGLNRLPEGLVVNDDTRFPREADALRERGFLIIKCSAPEGVRKSRGEAWTANDITETAYTDIKTDATVFTDGGLGETVAALLTMLK
jgi:hypothetical protein